MANIAEKQVIVNEVKDKLERAKAAILTDYRGLDVAEVTKLRAQLREAGVDYKVVKNTLMKIAAHDLGITDLDNFLEGPTAVAFSYDDPVAPAKLLSDFAKTHKDLEIKAGLLEGKFIGIDGIKALADLPPREVLLAQVVGAFQAPIANWVNVLQGPLRKFVYALEEIRKQKEAQQ